MVHGRMIRPPVAGATPAKIDEGSIKDIPGARVVHQNGFLGVVADKEWDAIKAAQKLKVEWSDAAPPFPDQAAIYDHIRKAPPRHRKVEKENGNVDEAFRNAARVVEAEYEWPFQSHACMGPGCGVVDVEERQGHGLDRLAQVALLPRRRRQHPRRSDRQGRRHLHAVRRRLRPQRRRRRLHGRRHPVEGGRQAGARAVHARRRHRLGPEGPGLDPPRPRRGRRQRQHRRLRVLFQGLLALGRADQRGAAGAHARGPFPRRAAEVRGHVRRAGGSLRVRQQAHAVGDDPAAARPRVAAAHLASARPGRAAAALRS